VAQVSPDQANEESFVASSSEGDGACLFLFSERVGVMFECRHGPVSRVTLVLGQCHCACNSSALTFQFLPFFGLG